MARRRLSEASKLAEGDDARAFYAEVARALRGLVADRLNLAEAGLKNSDVEMKGGQAGGVHPVVGLGMSSKSCPPKTYIWPRFVTAWK